MSYGRWLALIALAYLALTTFYNVAQPIWEAPEEPANVELVRYIQLNHDLPRVRPAEVASTPPSPPGQEFVQVPLYYVVLATTLGWIDLPPGATWHRNPYVAWPGHPFRYAVALHRADEAWPYRGLALLVHLGRLISALFGLVGLLASAELIRTICGRPREALFGEAWLALTPSLLLQGSRVSNDSAVLAFSALTLLFSARILTRQARVSAPSMLLLSAALGAAILSKADAVFLVPIVALTLLRATRLSGVDAWLRQGLLRAALVVVGPLALLLGWWWEYGRYFGSFLGNQTGAGVLNVWTVLVNAAWSRLPGAIWMLNQTWWGTAQFDELIRWTTPVYLAAAVPAAALLLLGFRAVSRRRFWLGLPPGSRAACGLFLVGSAPLLYAVFARTLIPWIGYSTQARFLLPLAPIVALLAALGWRFLPRWLAGWFAFAYLPALGALAIATPLVLFPRINAPLIPARLARSPAELGQSTVADFANGVSLISVDGLSGNLQPGQSRPLLLHVVTRHPPGADFTISTQLVDQSGDRVSGSDFIPYAKVFPPRLWETGELVNVPVDLPVPADLRPGQYAVRVVLYLHLGSETQPLPVLRQPATQTWVQVGSWRILPRVEDVASYHPDNVRFGDDLTLVGDRLSGDAPDLTVSLLWETRALIARRLVVSVQAFDAAGKLLAQHDGEPVGGRLPTPNWRPGDRIRDDHLVHLPPGLRFARVLVVVYDRQTSQRLPVVGPGALPDNAVQLPNK